MNKNILSFMLMFVFVVLVEMKSVDAVQNTDAIVRNATIEMMDVERQIPKDNIVKPHEGIQHSNRILNEPVKKQVIKKYDKKYNKNVIKKIK